MSFLKHVNAILEENRDMLLKVKELTQILDTDQKTAPERKDWRQLLDEIESIRKTIRTNYQKVKQITEHQIISQTMAHYAISEETRERRDEHHE